MGLETGTGIGDLVPANPLSTDAVSSGDDHIRLIKTVMQSITFLKSIQSFAASGTWTRPTNVKRVLVYCQGGGGGGNGGVNAGFAGGGGSSGAIAVKWIDVSAISSATVTVGTGGAGGTANGGLGGNGTSTTFVSAGPVTHCLAHFGFAGSATQFPGLVDPASNSIGDIIFTGSYGVIGTYPYPGAANPGGQGGGHGGYSTGPAMAQSGGGGGGGHAEPSTSTAGGAGGSGYCFVMEFGW